MMDLAIIREVIKRYDGVPSNMLTAAQRTARALLREVDRLNQELRLAEEGLANYEEEVQAQLAITRQRDEKIAKLTNDLAAREGKADRLRKGMESAYSVWSHAQEDCSVADRMADIINKTLQGEAKHG